MKLPYPTRKLIRHASSVSQLTSIRSNANIMDSSNGSVASFPSQKSNGIPPIPESHSSKKESHPPRRSSLNFLRRSKSGDPVRIAPPIVASAAPKLPDIFNGAKGNHPASPLPPPSRNGFGREIRDSVAIISGKFGTDDMSTSPEPIHRNGVASRGADVSGGRSADSLSDRSAANHHVKSSQVPPTDDPYAKEGSMAHRGRYSYASSAVSSTFNSPRRVRRRKDPTPFK